MAATKVQANWSAVAHAGVTIDRVTQMSFNVGGTLQSFSADTDHFPTVICNLMNKPTASVTSANAALLMGIVPGTTGTLTATHKDAKGASGGDILYTLINAVYATTSTSGGHNAFGTVNGNWEAYSSDGITNPLSFTRA